MSIPPTQPSSTPPSSNGDQGPEDKKKRRRDFKLPEKGEKEEEKRKKGVFEIAGDTTVKELKQQVQQSTQELKAEETSAISAKATISQVSQLIQRMVSQMQIGSVGGKTFASLNLSGSNEVPGAFQGSNLTLSYEKNGLIIRFDNFMSPQQQQNAFTLIERNKEQLAQMIQNLQSKNIQVAELNIGDRSITLPRVEPLPPPFQPLPSSQAETKRDRGGGGGGEQEKREGGPSPR